jgi:hypothetical protein
MGTDRGGGDRGIRRPASAASATVMLTLLAYGLQMYGLALPVAWRLARSASPALQP